MLALRPGHAGRMFKIQLTFGSKTTRGRTFLIVNQGFPGTLPGPDTFVDFPAAPAVDFAGVWDMMSAL